MALVHTKEIQKGGDNYEIEIQLQRSFGKRRKGRLASRGHYWRRQAVGLHASIPAGIVGSRGFDGLSVERRKAAAQPDPGLWLSVHLRPGRGVHSALRPRSRSTASQ